jgi:stage V sporulation protein R
MARSESLPPDLARQVKNVEVIARSAGLDFFRVIFELLDARDVNALAAYGGFPVRYPSWRFGMEYERLDKSYSWGLSKIYELVINNDPTYAYLVRANSSMEQKLVMAHVYGHADFFKNNIWFAPTNRRMVDGMAANSMRIRRYVDSEGKETVERFLDLALALDNLIDPYLPLREFRKGTLEQTPVSPVERARRSLEAASARPEPQAARSEDQPERVATLDILGFLCEHADLSEWERDVLRIVRDEAYYFMPQRMTKIMNEGWASFWHSRILTRSVLGTADIIDFADTHSGATMSSPGQLNPYKLGIDLFRHAEKTGLDLFQLRAIHNDVSFLDAVVDEEFARKSEMFTYHRNSRTGQIEVSGRDWREIKMQLLGQLASGGMPQIELLDDDFNGRGELLLRHRFDGRELQLEQASETLKQLVQLWKRPCHLLTRSEGKPMRLSSDGEEVTRVEAAEAG